MPPTINVFLKHWGFLQYKYYSHCNYALQKWLCKYAVLYRYTRNLSQILFPIGSVDIRHQIFRVDFRHMWLGHLVHNAHFFSVAFYKVGKLYDVQILGVVWCFPAFTAAFHSLHHCVCVCSWQISCADELCAVRLDACIKRWECHVVVFKDVLHVICVFLSDSWQCCAPLPRNNQIIRYPQQIRLQRLNETDLLMFCWYSSGRWIVSRCHVICLKCFTSSLSIIWHSLPAALGLFTLT